MAPLRRYLRITKYSVLETRIYLEQPALTHSWLLGGRDPAMPRIIAAIKNLVKNKLREENEWAVRTAKGVGIGKRATAAGPGAGKKSGVQEVIVGDDFEVSIFLTDHSTRHSLLRRQRTIREHKKTARLAEARERGRTGTLSGWVVPLPQKDGEGSQSIQDGDGQGQTANSAISLDDQDPEHLPSNDPLSGLSPSIGQQSHVGITPSSPLLPRSPNSDSEMEGSDVDVKKIQFDTSYEGFSIYGRILSLVVKQVDRDAIAAAAAAAAAAATESRSTVAGGKGGRKARGSKGAKGKETVPVGGDLGGNDDGTMMATGGEQDEGTRVPITKSAVGNILEHWISTQVAAAGQRGHGDGDDDDY